MTEKYSGQCACGTCKFEFTLDPAPAVIANCHCNDCKKSSGGEMATLFAIPAKDFVLVSGKPKPFHYIADSGKGLDRNFCPAVHRHAGSVNVSPRSLTLVSGSLNRKRSS